MQDTQNKYLESKKRNPTLGHAKTGKHECRKITAMYKTVRPKQLLSVFASHDVNLQSVQ